MGKCRHCKKDVLIDAVFCSSCGKRVQDASVKGNDDWRNLGIAGAIIAALFLLASLSDIGGGREASTQPPTHEQQISRGFSAWDGSHRALTSQVKGGLKDPRSFEHVETRYTDHGDNTLTVTMRYRAKNSFGAVVPGFATAKVHVDGHVIEIISSQ